ncbi:endonuclease/exonuclease/phosphatase family protein [bacterium]|nr:endonuclease/exonuclease/phosphatase family protein [bacterium]
MPRSRKRKLGREERFILDVLVVLVVALVGIRYLPGEWLISLEWLTGNQVARLGLGLIALLFALINFLRRRPISGGVALVPVLVILIETWIFVPFSGTDPVPPDAETVRVLTFNNATERTDGVLEGIVESGAQIACLQEFPITGHQIFLDSAKSRGYDGWFVLLRDDAGMGTVVLSREPLTRIDTLFTSSWNEKVRRFTRVNTTAHGRTVRVASVQLESTNRKSDLWGVIESWKLRMEQANRVKDALLGGSTPVLLAGDLNSTPTNRAIRPLLQSMRDSWKDAGRGYGGTWHRSFRLFRIDYILFNHFEGAANPRFIKLGRSDHVAYVVDLILPPVSEEAVPSP